MENMVEQNGKGSFRMSTVQPIIYDTEGMAAPEIGNSLYTSRNNVYSSSHRIGAPKVSVAVLSYNRLEQTKQCVQYVLQYTKNIDYELILIDNGSDPGVLEFFQSVEFPKKKIIRVTKNIGSMYGINTVYPHFEGEYLAIVNCDIFVTTNWLTNLISCMESDPKIGFVTPISSNVSNLQNPGWVFENMEQMQKMAERYNQPDPLKWEERIRLMPTITLYKREIIDLVGKNDVGFFHDFSDDDLCIRIRRAGYKLILCGDTYIHHDHIYDSAHIDTEKFSRSIDEGRKNFFEKYHGIDGWDDILNFELDLVGMLSQCCQFSSKPSLLGVDVRCGTPVLDLRNFLHKRGITPQNTSTFTCNAKYYEDLLTISDDVQCDTIHNLFDYYEPDSFDFVITGEPINLYEKPIRVLQTLLKITKKNGYVLIKLRNTMDIRAFLAMMLLSEASDGDMPIHISIDDLAACLKLMKVSNVNITPSKHQIDPNTLKTIKKGIGYSKLTMNIPDVLERLSTKDYLICIQK